MRRNLAARATAWMLTVALVVAALGSGMPDGHRYAKAQLSQILAAPSTVCDADRADTTLILNLADVLTDASPIGATYAASGGLGFTTAVGNPFGAGGYSLGPTNGSSQAVGVSGAHSGITVSGTGNFDIAGWFYPTSLGAGYLVSGNGANGQFAINESASGFPQVGVWGSGWFLTSSVKFTVSTWNFLEVTRVSATTSIGVGTVAGGLAAGGSASDTNNYTAGSGPTIGGASTTPWFAGYIAPQRWTVGVGRTQAVPTGLFPTC